MSDVVLGRTIGVKVDIGNSRHFVNPARKTQPNQIGSKRECVTRPRSARSRLQATDGWELLSRSTGMAWKLETRIVALAGET
jgi:hypothetical protein